MCVFWFFIMTSVRSEARLCLCHASHQFAHAALLSHAVFAFVVEAHLASLAAQAVLRRVSRQKHHMLGRRTCEDTRGKEARGSDQGSLNRK